MGPKLKLIIESEEVRLLYSEKERVGSPPRLAEQFVSRLASLKRAVSPPRSVEQETGPFKINTTSLARAPRIVIILTCPIF